MKCDTSWISTASDAECAWNCELSLPLNAPVEVIGDTGRNGASRSRAGSTGCIGTRGSKVCLCSEGTLVQQAKMKTVLVVDDELSIVTAWKRVLQLEGYRVVTASNGREGLVAANEEKPDLIITDWSMPIMDGIEFCRHLKLEREFARVPVILTSAGPPGPGDTAVWDDFWLKPVSIEMLLASVQRLLDACS